MLALCAGCFFKPDPPSDEPTGDGGVDANVSDYTRRRQITITRGPMPNLDDTLSDFPVSVYVESDPDLQANSSGTDILFTAADGTTPLAFEIVTFVAGEGRLDAWVLVPSLPVGVTELFMYYGGPTVTNDPTKVWKDAFAVWHMGHVGQEPDASGNVGNLEGTLMKIPGVAAGLVGSARNYDGDDYLCVKETNVLSFGADAFSVSAWVKTTPVSLFDAPFWRGGDGTAGGFTIELGTSPWQAIVRDSNMATITLDLGQPTTNWTFLGFSANNPIDSFDAYRDGVHRGNGIAAGFGAVPSIDDFCLGRSTYPYNGLLDEVRVWSKARPADWYAVEYMNIAERTGFITVLDPE